MLQSVALLAVPVLTPAVFAQLRDAIVVKDCPMSKSSGQALGNQSADTWKGAGLLLMLPE
jgi:hypothetical protein